MADIADNVIALQASVATLQTELAALQAAVAALPASNDAAVLTAISEIKALLTPTPPAA